ncbi:MAG: (3R)-3-methyl-D-ornithine:L-lysine ligase pyrrolysine biosynthesis protein PylC [Candidatus Methanohalarchaeum thermophilum]|uniref:(3R)-3-methyl-D-ornithine:L-lysine ligase pyrrolysine biosynthesis protein PylC n=1 Tax=Methanohalarchaeum thermophilum TaxID=1903181 RepID=A0A1Q6DT35_METT1|nr:MAG: (3R)-3-methyl-D-ornithine:L-lysine ligase pyrrolysine biosynthesis protein PylC [Candidatus Methanohalarchaeum thermophilum]
MNLVVVGGGLQGLELCYLANKANIETTLIDKKEDPIAKGLADNFISMDVTDSVDRLRKKFEKHSYLVPATESLDALRCLDNEFDGKDILFDFKSFFLTSDKKRMYQMLSENTKVPPRATVDSDFPVIVKPVRGSGSKGIRKISSESEFKKFKSGKKDFSNNYLAQKYLKGRQYSTEAVVKNGRLYSYQTTLLEFQSDYGCCRIVCNPNIPKEIINKQKKAIKDIYKSFSEINYLFDVQTLFDGKELYLIEINARFPSQTPISVYWSTGINLLNQLIKPQEHMIDGAPVILEHFKLNNNNIEIISEAKLLEGSDYRIKKKLPGCKEAIIGKTDNNKKIGTAIFKEKNLIEIEKQRKKFYKTIK